jgi:serine/threonine protein kinase
MVDFWTFGCLIHEMLTGFAPFRHNNQNILFSKIRVANFVMPQDFDVNTKDLISRLLVPDVNFLIFCQLN